MVMVYLSLALCFLRKCSRLSDLELFSKQEFAKLVSAKIPGEVQARGGEFTFIRGTSATNGWLLRRLMFFAYRQRGDSVARRTLT